MEEKKNQIEMTDMIVNALKTNGASVALRFELKQYDNVDQMFADLRVDMENLVNDELVNFIGVTTFGTKAGEIYCQSYWSKKEDAMQLLEKTLEVNEKLVPFPVLEEGSEQAIIEEA